MALALQREVTARHRHPLRPLMRCVVARVGEHEGRLTVDVVLEHAARQGAEFEPDPLTERARRRRAADAVIVAANATDVHVGLYRAHVPGGRGVRPFGQELRFERDREVLLDGNRCDRLHVIEDARVELRPVLPARGLLAREAVLKTQTVVLIGRLVDQVAVALREVVAVLIEARLDHAFLDAKRVAEVLPCRVACDLRNPAVERPPIEERDPLGVGAVGSPDGLVRAGQ